jgi:hypothetical protein
MEAKNTKSYLAKLEDIFAETEYHLRYEKGNKYYTVEGKINALIEILKNIEVKLETLSEKNRKLFHQLNQQTLEL